MKKIIFIFCLLTLIQLIHATSEAQTQSGSSSGNRPWLLSKGSAAREAKRFNLYDWLEEKNRMQVMDMWLSLNTPSPYEFMLGGSLNQFTVDNHVNPATKTKSYDGEFTAYAKLVGLTGEYQNNTEESYHDTTGIFNLRLFGQTIQGTHLTVHYGLRTRTDNAAQYRLNQQFLAGTFQLYLMQYFGISANYRHFYPVTEGFFGETEASSQTYGAFIDFSSLRVMGSYFSEKQKFLKNNIESTLERSGPKISLQLFF